MVWWAGKGEGRGGEGGVGEARRTRVGSYSESDRHRWNRRRDLAGLVDDHRRLRSGHGAWLSEMRFVCPVFLSITTNARDAREAVEATTEAILTFEDALLVLGGAYFIYLQMSLNREVAELNQRITDLDKDLASQSEEAKKAKAVAKVAKVSATPSHTLSSTGFATNPPGNSALPW